MTDRKTAADSKAAVDERLDEQLDDSFPASDPPSITAPRKHATKALEDDRPSGHGADD